MLMSPRHTTAEIGGAVVRWFCTRRGRKFLLSLVVFIFMLALAGVQHSDTITEKYHALFEYQWRPFAPSPAKPTYPAFKTPSNTTLKLENGEIEHLPPKLVKTTPNFHLLMRSEKDSDAFCKSTLSAMLLNYPPPTAVTIGRTFVRPGHRERHILTEIHEYLHNEKLVHEKDLLLIVDGQDTWFQLPSDAVIKQYEAVVENANARLLRKYGVDESKRQKFNQTIVFGAEKVCEGDATACNASPESILPHDIYGVVDETTKPKDLPARYLNAKILMGPAEDLRVLFDAALKRSEQDVSEKQTMQSILTAMFGDQQLRRDATLVESRSTSSRLREWVGPPSKDHASAKRRLGSANTTILNDRQREYSIGLDYTHTLFQPLLYTHMDEIVPLRHGNLSDLAKYRHHKTLTPQLKLPSSLLSSKLPFWSPNLFLHNPSPETNMPAYIDRLEYDFDLDRLPDRHIPWSNISLIQNTYTGAIPALILRVPEAVDHTGAKISFNNLWFAPWRRALLRQYFRTRQSPNGYHNSAVGGDRFWDQRGGRGGIWTSKEQTWLSWGEVDGVCGTLAHMQQVFDDGRGVWMHELEEDNEGQRVKDEVTYKTELEEKKERQLEKEKAEVQVAAEVAKQEHKQEQQEQKENQEKERLEEDQRLRKIQDEEVRINLEKLKAVEAAERMVEEAETARKKIEEQGANSRSTSGAPARRKKRRFL
jgi:hypothetical protein